MNTVCHFISHTFDYSAVSFEQRVAKILPITANLARSFPGLSGIAGYIPNWKHEVTEGP
jgi:hypothetical protein